MPVLGVERRGCLGGGELGGSEPVGKLGSARERARVVNMFGLQKGKTPDGPHALSTLSLLRPLRQLTRLSTPLSSLGMSKCMAPLDIPHPQAVRRWVAATAGPAPPDRDAVGAVDGSRSSSLQSTETESAIHHRALSRPLPSLKLSSSSVS